MSSLVKLGTLLGNRLATPATVPTRELSPVVLRLATLLDDAFEIPGTNYRIGLDGLIGLIPGIGDLATLIVGGILLQEANRLGVSRWTKARMCGNYAIDLLVGAIPFAGDLFDFAFKANRRNVQLLQQHLEREKARTGTR